MPEPLLVSYGSSPYEKKNGRDTLWHLFEAISDCLQRAGVTPGETGSHSCRCWAPPDVNMRGPCCCGAALLTAHTTNTGRKCRGQPPPAFGARLRRGRGGQLR